KADIYRTYDDDGNALPMSIDDLKNSWISKEYAPCVFISATSKLNIEELRTTVLERIRREYSIRYPYSIV
ncbi:MAG TPA: GTPase HflX, partial [Bacteroidia bacterium]|nr:GTPase HflX [Bacteroidia bacterium]